jgi:hypothetical protein
MSAYDTQARETAARLLGSISRGGKGQSITLTRAGVGGVYDPATSTVSTGADTVQSTSGVVLEYGSFERGGQRNDPGALIQIGDKRLLLSGLTLAGAPLSPPPGPGDTVTLADGVAYTITSAAPLAPAGTAIFFECNIRGAS